MSSGKNALKEAQSGATLALWLAALGMVQMCCAGAPLTVEPDGTTLRETLGFVAMLLSLTGSVLALPARLLFSMGVGGRKGGRRYENLDARVAAGVAVRPVALPRIFLVGATASAFLVLSEAVVLAAVVPTLKRHALVAVMAMLLDYFVPDTVRWLPQVFR